MRNESVVNVCASDFHDIGYNIKRDGWLNNFTEEKNQAIRENGVPWRGAREKRHEFFSILFSSLTDDDDIIMNWQCGVDLFFISLYFKSLFSYVSLLLYLLHFPLISVISPHCISIF